MGFAESEKKVISIISNSKEGLTQTKISLILRMPKRTVRHAIFKLKRRGLLKEFLNFDARMGEYRLSGRRGA